MERSGMRERPSRISLRSIRATRFADSRANLMGDTISPETPASLRAAALAFDLRKLDRRFLEDPYPVYRALREHDPVHRMPDGSYFLSRYEDCAEVYRDPACWSSDKKIDFRPNFADSLLYEHHTTSLVFNDPPYHTRVRKLLAPAFTPRALKALQPRIEALVDRLLDRAAERRSFDLIDDFAAAIPVQLIGDMLGVPSDERGPLRGWSLAILGALEPVLARAQFERGVTAVAEFKAYLIDLIDRRIHQEHGREGEILSTLIAASDFAPPKAAQERLRGRVAAQLHLSAQRRPRDHHEPHRQRHRPAHPQSRCDARLAKASGVHRRR